MPNDFYGQQPKRKYPRPGTPPNPSRKPRVPGSYRGHPSRFYDPITKTWNQPRNK